MPDPHPHEWTERRSLALHREVARRLCADPAVLDRARQRVGQWRRDGSVDPFYAEAWDRLLRQPPHEVASAIVAPGEAARALRQVSPFAGAIDPRTRWRILREVTYPRGNP